LTYVWSLNIRSGYTTYQKRRKIPTFRCGDIRRLGLSRMIDCRLYSLSRAQTRRNLTAECKWLLREVRSVKHSTKPKLHHDCRAVIKIHLLKVVTILGGTRPCRLTQPSGIRAAEASTFTCGECHCTATCGAVFNMPVNKRSIAMVWLQTPRLLKKSQSQCHFCSLKPK
jgi:hypothetical protein